MPPFGTSSSCRDRTSEFLSVVDRLQQQQGATSSGQPTENGGATTMAGPLPGGAAAQQSEFARRAARIGQVCERA
ncbi:hypothetical protein WJX72_003661 [[Myrmecia] bisecta]|uniref:Syntaxin-5 N-terminal Sly1p-binding domain-containing protein n=1 Tax=[Myrmecia] bisecta TaxID=41462 RepID=A0AAW1PJL9_9CHLO